MFLSDRAHEHLLAPSDYSAPEMFAREQEGIFRRSWICVAAFDQLAESGQQLGIEVGGVPVVVRNDGGTIRAFKNVCAHRHSLVARPGFTCRPTLQCQYHGWEYGTDGKLARLPDGQSFKGWKAAGARLDPLRCETAWGLVFVNATPGETTLRADLGALAPDLDRHFGGMRHHYTQITEHDVNWKVIVENAVEGYHVPMVHATTFVTYGEERFHDHVITPQYTQFHDLSSQKSDRDRMIDKMLFRSERLWTYSHTLAYPNHMLSWAGFYREWVVVEPLGPRKSRRIGYGFFPDDLRLEGRLALPLRLAVKEIARRTRKMADKILGEDSSLWESVQRGTESSTFAGVISAREERVAAFQRWVVDHRAQP